ncbi:MAG: carboxymuconolactone decarboxylase family protein [Candidatus Heimdallarchaeota archaeon]|nr:carboxymuconolactone decarboxylase family protein [Candidatus Heimdallarchaeota archaeon]MCK4290808.1 carboxymuconolactone decarboxylase family protein [Candidatus Heimdallarchaeota archaeon]
MASINTFHKRRYTFQSLFKDIKQLIANFQQVKETFTSNRISRQFAERIMLSVTSINNCIYCSYGHSGAALKSGAYEAEIISIFDNSFESCKEDEIVALNFAKHCARSNNNPTKKEKEKLVNYYGLQKARDVLVYIQIITLGNLMGNAVEAYEARKKGITVEDGSLLFDSFAFVLAKPFFKQLKKSGIDAIGDRLSSGEDLMKFVTLL